MLPVEQGLSKLVLLLCAGVGTQESTQLPHGGMGCSCHLQGCEISLETLFFSESAWLPFLSTHMQDSFQTGSFHQLKVCRRGSEI